MPEHSRLVTKILTNIFRKPWVTFTSNLGFQTLTLFQRQYPFQVESKQGF
jgi:hypothetical protein